MRRFHLLLCTAMLVHSVDALAEVDSLHAVVEAIGEIQSVHGINAPNLIDPLTALALYYQEHEEHDRAAAAVQRARQVVRVNYGLYSLQEAPLLMRLIEIEDSRGHAEGAWDLEQRLIRLVGRHPDDLRTVPVFLQIAARRMDVLTRYQAGEFPPEIVLGCYYSERRYDPVTGAQVGTGCRAGSRRRVIGALQSEVARYEAEARRIRAHHERQEPQESQKPQERQEPQEPQEP